MEMNEEVDFTDEKPGVIEIKVGETLSIRSNLPNAEANLWLDRAKMLIINGGEE